VVKITKNAHLQYQKLNQLISVEYPKTYQTLSIDYIRRIYYPNISFIIPVRSKTNYIKVVESINRLTYPESKIEIIIEKGSNPPAQRNSGISQSSGDIVAFVDDDCVFHEDWLKNALKYFENEKVGVVGGPNLTPPEDSFLSKCFGHAMASYFGAASMSNRYKSAKCSREASEQDLILANMICRKEIFDQGMYFNEELFPNEENEFMNRVAKKGYTIIYDPEIFVYHPRKKTLLGFTKQLFGYGCGRAKQSNSA
jgi:cellulose synthase/poly-beta-1,6-N-acetylglucosamine synthase-like glycosyltransferase